jgi:hypothetical protein
MLGDSAGSIAEVCAASFPHSEDRGRERVLDPARGCRPAIFRAGVEGDGGLGRGAMDRVDHRFKHNQAARWQADTRANHYAVVDVTG